MENEQQQKRRGRFAMSNIVTTAAVAYSAYQLGSWAWNQYCSASNNTKTDDWKGRRTRLRNCRMDVRRTLCRFLPTIRTIVEERIPTKEPTQALKALRADSGDSAKQDELWEVLHTRFLTRLLVTLYSYTLLSLTLTVQIHYLASRRPEKGSSEHQLALRQTYEFFLKLGLYTDVRQCFSKQDVGAMIFSIRQQVEGTKRKRSLLRFIMSPAAYGFSDERSHLFDEMWDIMESPVMKDAESDALGFFFGKLQESGWGTAFEDDSSTKPLASIIPMFKHSVNQIFQTNEDDLEYLTAIQNLPTVLELADMSFTPDNRR